MKQMIIVPSNGTKHAYDCATMCPINGTFHSTVTIGDAPDPPFSFTKPRHLRLPGAFRQPSIVGGQSKVLDRWRWEQKIAVLPMGFITAYVDTTSSPAQIFGIAKSVVPIHAWENVSFVGFKPEDQLNASLDRYFDIDPSSIASCPKAQSGCFEGIGFVQQQGSIGKRQGSIHDQEQEETFTVSAHIARAMRAASRTPSDLSLMHGQGPAPLPNVTFAADYAAKISQLTITNQNGEELPNGDLCCSYGAVGAPPVCSAAIAKTAGVEYFDTTNQRYRYENAQNQPGAAEVSDYKTHKQMIVGYRNGTTETVCKQYCPIDARDVLKPHFFGFGNKVKDDGPTTWHGHAAQHYHWVTKADPLPIPLQTIDFYADISKPHAAVPLFQRTAVTPLGIKPVGFFNKTWEDFSAGPPDPAKFDIHGVDTCPKASNCGAPPMQDRRLLLGMYHTYARYAQGDI